jgi:hypothetical protein
MREFPLSDCRVSCYSSELGSNVAKISGIRTHLVDSAGCCFRPHQWLHIFRNAELVEGVLNPKFRTWVMTMPQGSTGQVVTGYHRILEAKNANGYHNRHGSIKQYVSETKA